MMLNNLQLFIKYQNHYQLKIQVIPKKKQFQFNILHQMVPFTLLLYL